MRVVGSLILVASLLVGCNYQTAACCGPYGDCVPPDIYGSCPDGYNYSSDNHSNAGGGATTCMVTTDYGTGTVGTSTTGSVVTMTLGSGASSSSSSTTGGAGASTAGTSGSASSTSGGSGGSSSASTSGTGGSGTGGSGGTSGSTSGGGTSGGIDSGVDGGFDGGFDGGLDGGDAGSVPTIGSSCTCDADCSSGQFCFPQLNFSSDSDAGTQWVNGYCTVYNCDQQTPCPDGALCYNYPQGSPSLYSLCLATCSSPACDRTGYTCSELGDPVLACLPECVHDCDCSSGLVCESGSCQQPCYVDSECGPNEVCNGNHCQAGPPLACCDLVGMAPCPTGMSCESGMCIISCQFDVQCPAGERCLSNGQCG